MRDLSLHILDLVENSLRVQAAAVRVTLEQDTAADQLRICVEDNGPGLPVEPGVALDPFYTTKTGKRTGLGLSLFQSAAERAGGSLTLSRSELGGLCVTATMRLGHVDRAPLGDLGATIASIACMNPELDLTCVLVVNRQSRCIRAADLAASHPTQEAWDWALMRKMSARIEGELESLGASH